MLRQASYGTIKIGTYQSFKRLLVERPEGEAHFLSVIVQAWFTSMHTVELKFHLIKRLPTRKSENVL